MQCPKCHAGSSVSTTIQFNGEVKRHRKCKECGDTFITLESVIEALPKGRPAKQMPVPDERGLFKNEDVSAIKMQKVHVRRKNEDRVSSYYIEDDYE
jgi:transcriptional regulator NrdR family protein